MESVLDLDRYPIDRLETTRGRELVQRCIEDLARDGMFNLSAFLRPEVLPQVIAQVRPVIDGAAFTHRRSHNIYFRKDIPGLPSDHPALQQVVTVNHTICGDQIPDSIVKRIYDWSALPEFIASVMGKDALYPMADQIAGANVMEYRDGEALNWHFDRSEFTTTLLLQAPDHGGDFEYRSNLRTDDNPNYDGVARLLEGSDPQSRILKLSPGTLNVFRGKNTAHRVTTVAGNRSRIIAVFSYYDQPGRMFSAEERLGFYGRAS